MVSALKQLEVRNAEDVIAKIERDNKVLRYVWSTDHTPAGRCNALRAAGPALDSGDTLRIQPGDWDFGDQYVALPNGIVLAGCGMGVTRLINRQLDQANRCGFQIGGRGLSLRELSLIWEPADKTKPYGGQTLGMTGNNGISMTAASATEIEAISYGGAAIYFWSDGKGHQFKAKKSNFYSGRWCGCLGAGSAEDSALLTFVDCNFTTDFGKYGGAGGLMGMPPNTVGFVSRGGRTTITGGSINVKGYPGSGVVGDNNKDPFKMVYGAACSSLGDPGNPLPEYTWAWPYLTIDGVTFNIQPNGIADWADVWAHIGTTLIRGGRGSGLNGAYVLKGKRYSLEGGAIAA